MRRATMFAHWRRTSLAGCLALSAALFVLGPSARADRYHRRERSSEEHARWSHSRWHHPSPDREQARSDRRGSRSETHRGREHQRSERTDAHRRGSGGRHHWAMRDHGRGPGHGFHRYASHRRRHSHWRSGRETAPHSGSGSRAGTERRHFRGEASEGGGASRHRDGGQRGQRDRARDS
jgi:hypothetical protein